jgi:polar amino acid transport system substrate-binding protein
MPDAGQKRHKGGTVKKLFALGSLLVVLALLVGACGSAADQIAQGPAACPTCQPEKKAGPPYDLAGRSIRIASEDAYPPFHYISKDTNERVGFDVDLWAEVCKRLNCTPDFQLVSWDSFFEALSVGEYDVGEGGITFTFPRALKVAYSIPYVEYGQVVLVRADDTRFPDEQALINSTALVGCQLGTTNEVMAQKMVGADRIKAYDVYDMPIVALMSGDIDAVIIDEVAGIGFMGENPGKMKVAFSVTSGELLAFVFPPTSELLVPFNYTLQQMFKDGTMDPICTKWLLRPCSPQTD